MVASGNSAIAGITNLLFAPMGILHVVVDSVTGTVALGDGLGLTALGDVYTGVVGAVFTA